EQAKLESQVHRRISELRKEGQWSASRLPKLVEASRPKSQWDYLLEEMQWMAADFAQERRWKEAAAKKLVRTCARYHQEQKRSEERHDISVAAKVFVVSRRRQRDVVTLLSQISPEMQYLHFKVVNVRLKRANLDFHPFSCILTSTPLYTSGKRQNCMQIVLEGNIRSSPLECVGGSMVPRNIINPPRQLTEQIKNFQDSKKKKEKKEALVEKEEIHQRTETKLQTRGFFLLPHETTFPLPNLIQCPPPTLQVLSAPWPTSTPALSPNWQEAMACPLLNPVALVKIQEAAAKKLTKHMSNHLATACSHMCSLPSRTEEESTGDKDEVVADEESTTAEQEVMEGEADHKAELFDLAKDGISFFPFFNPTVATNVFQLHKPYSKPNNKERHAVMYSIIKLAHTTFKNRIYIQFADQLDILYMCPEVPLDVLAKQYAGAYAEGFEWPQSSLQSDDDEDDDMDDTKGVDPDGTAPGAVVIDSLLNVDQYCASDKSASSVSDGKPGRDIAEVAAATELILPKGSFRTTSSTHSPAPFLLHGSLREYQQIGVDWLMNLYKKKLNGILADESGLGKTVQTVAYMAHLAGQEGVWGPHLIVVRTCRLLNWEVEFKRWCPGLKILLYLGNKRERRSMRMWWKEANSFHVCLTSYKLLMKDQCHFMRRRWRHLVLDEVQLIKNMTQKHWETIFSLQSQQRILLISSPLQNTLKELWTMIHFLLPGITKPYSDFPVKAGTDQNQDYCHKLVIRLHRMIQPFILRRSKRDVEKQLPKKYEHILKCRLSARQKSLYEDILTQPGAQEALKMGHFVSVQQVLMQLQRVCNHPELVAPRENFSSYFWPSLEYRVPSLVLGALQEENHKVYR
uniref:E1A binding protein p400 n=1 Tax=Tetraodon nigroviridis TaxID=99883 RepID=H3CBP0_TETNG